LTPDPLLARLIRSTYTLDEIRHLRTFLAGQGTFSFSSFDNGLFPAAVVEDSADVSGYANVWVRDNFHIAYAHFVIGHADVAVRNVRSLLQFFRKYRGRLCEVLAGNVDPDEVMNRPHIRFDGVNLAELDQQWPHAQNDALGYFLWLAATLIDSGDLVPTADELETMTRLVCYLQKIRFWQDEDSGHWEEQRKQSASSIGVATAALIRLREMFSSNPSLLEMARAEGWSLTLPILEELIQAGKLSLRQILPAECVQPDPLKNRRYDAAVLFLIHPLKVVDEPAGRTLVGDVTSSLQGDFGIRRYQGDSYWAPDYKKKLSAEVRTSDFSEHIGDRDKLLDKLGNEAQWCLFDPIVSCIYGEWFRQTRDPADLAKQVEYLNRSLSQMTRAHSSDDALRSPELYYIEEGCYVPNDHTPLLWSEANLLQALHGMEQSLTG
jgi:phosphorylase kinase alpha/beta subunit